MSFVNDKFRLLSKNNNFKEVQLNVDILWHEFFDGVPLETISSCLDRLKAGLLNLHERSLFSWING